MASTVKRSAPRTAAKRPAPNSGKPVPHKKKAARATENALFALFFVLRPKKKSIFIFISPSILSPVPSYSNKVCRKGAKTHENQTGGKAVCPSVFYPMRERVRIMQISFKCLQISCCYGIL